MMEELNLLKRTHGGAIPMPMSRQSPRSNQERYGKANTQQQQIAKEAVARIEPEQTVFIGGASIHYALLQYLPVDFAYTVVTNSVEIAYHLRDYTHVTTYLIGGEVKSSGNMTDSLALENSRRFSVDLCFASAGGISAKGLSTATPEVAVFHEHIYAASAKVIALVEHHKFDTTMFSSICPLARIHEVITDSDTLDDHLAPMKNAGVSITIADTEAG